MLGLFVLLASLFFATSLKHFSLKRPHEEDDSNDDEDEHEEEEEEGHFKTTDNDESDGNSSPSRKLREPRSCTLKGSDGVILKQMLNYLVKNLQKYKFSFSNTFFLHVL